MPQPQHLELEPPPIDASERETAYLLRSETMKKRLLEAIARDGEGAVLLEEVKPKLFPIRNNEEHEQMPEV